MIMNLKELQRFRLFEEQYKTLDPEFKRRVASKVGKIGETLIEECFDRADSEEIKAIELAYLIEKLSKLNLEFVKALKKAEEGEAILLVVLAAMNSDLEECLKELKDGKRD